MTELSKKPPYFNASARYGAEDAVPRPLVCDVERDVRFEEVDSLRVVWHGRYPSYFEDGRTAFGQKFGLGYLDMYQAGIVIPIKQMHIDYHAPLRFGERCRIRTSLHWSEAARLNFSYELRSPENALLTTGYTVQLFVDLAGKVVMFKPDFYERFCSRWSAGLLDAVR